MARNTKASKNEAAETKHETTTETVAASDKDTDLTVKPAQENKPAETVKETPDSAATVTNNSAQQDNSEENNNMGSVMTELMIKLLEDELRNNNEYAKKLLLQRLAADNISHVRVPVPLNITEIGGYYNLLSDAFGDDKTMARQMLAAVLGLPYIG